MKEDNEKIDRDRDRDRDKEEIFSRTVRAGKRTYFFDVKEKSGSEKKYLRITESKFQGEGKERKYNSFILFPENLVDFQNNLKEAATSLTGN